MRRLILIMAALIITVMVTGCGPWGAGGGEQRWWIKTWPRGCHCSVIDDGGIEICLNDNGGLQ